MMSLTITLLYVLIALLIFIIHKWRQHMRFFENAGIPHEKPSMFVGNMQGFKKTRSLSQITTDYYYKFKGAAPFVGFYFYQKRYVLVIDKELIKNILVKDFSNFADRGFYSNEKDDPLTGQLFVLDGHRWRNMRNKLSPTFTSGKMKFMFPTVLEAAKNFQQVFAEMVIKDSIIEIKDIFARFTTDVIGTCAFGIECNSLRDPEVEFRIMGKKSQEIVFSIPILLAIAFPDLGRKLGIKIIPDYLTKFHMRVVTENVEYRERNNIRRNDFMDMLIDLKNNKIMPTEDGMDVTNLTIGQIAAQAYVFFGAGFETSSSTMSFAIYELAQKVDIQQRAREEIQRVLAKYNQQYTYESLNEMVYLNQIISETLRLHTILPMLNRQALSDYTVPGNSALKIPKGMGIIIPTEAIHRDPEYYPNPEVFDPERFTPELVKERDSALWLPFGDGPRNCIGMRFGQMQTRLGLAVLLEKFKFSVCEKTQIPILYNPEIMLKATKDGIYVHVEEV